MIPGPPVAWCASAGEPPWAPQPLTKTIGDSPLRFRDGEAVRSNVDGARRGQHPAGLGLVENPGGDESSGPGKAGSPVDRRQLGMACRHPRRRRVRRRSRVRPTGRRPAPVLAYAAAAGEANLRARKVSWQFDPAFAVAWLTVVESGSQAEQGLGGRRCRPRNGRTSAFSIRGSRIRSTFQDCASTARMRSLILRARSRARCRGKPPRLDSAGRAGLGAGEAPASSQVRDHAADTRSWGDGSGAGHLSSARGRHVQRTCCKAATGGVASRPFEGGNHRKPTDRSYRPILARALASQRKVVLAHQVENRAHTAAQLAGFLSSSGGRTEHGS